MKAFIIILVIALLLTIVIPASAIILYFSDGFESGNFTAWDDWNDDGGDLSVAVGAALHGFYGLSVYIHDTNDKFVVDNTPNAETRYRCRFYFDLNGLTMTDSEDQTLFAAVDAVDDAVFKIRLIYSDVHKYRISIMTKEDGGWVYSKDHTITDAPHCIEIDWKAATDVGQNNGYMTLWINGVSKETLANTDNDTKSITDCYLGALATVRADTDGIFYLDDFASNDDGSSIGQPWKEYECPEG